MIDLNPISEKPFATYSKAPMASNTAAPSSDLAQARTDLAALHKGSSKQESESMRMSADHPLVRSLNTWLKRIYQNNKSGIDWVDKTLLDDKSIFRKIFSLENELAEALEPSMKQLKAPAGITSFIYRLLWGVCYLNTFTRVAIESLKQGNAIHGLKKLVQDGISVIALTTYFARGLNWLQDKIEDSVGVPSMIKNLLRPFLTVGGCIKAIDYFDEYAGVPSGELAVKGVEKLLDMTRQRSTNSAAQAA